MRKQFIITTFLALGMGITQAQTQPTTPSPMQSGSADQRQGTIQQQAPASAAQTQGTASATQAGSQSFKGCLNGSSGSWSLISDDGKTLTLSGTDNQLSQYKGQEVRIQGVQSNDGSVAVASVDQVSSTCANQAAGNMSGQSSTAAQSDTTSQSTATTSTTQNTTQPPSNAETTQAPATTTTPETKGEVSGQAATTAPGATTPPVTSQNPPNGVGSGQTATAQNPPASTADQNAAASSTSTGQSSTANQNADQGVKHYSDMDQNAASNTGKNLPQTASPLPLLGLLGLGSLLTGLISRRKK
jgi:peptidoglycan DL-endopeptidase CwlO